MRGARVACLLRFLALYVHPAPQSLPRAPGGAVRLGIPHWAHPSSSLPKPSWGGGCAGRKSVRSLSQHPRPNVEDLICCF